MIFVTGNERKAEEVKAILKIDVVCRALDLKEIQGSVAEIAIDKCVRAAEAIGGEVICEDTSLSFNALKGLPGPYIKHFLKLGSNDLVKLLDSFDDKSGYALCTFAYCAGPGKEVILFDGRCDGQIVTPRGPTSFGW